MNPFKPRLAYYVLKSRAYHAILRTPRFRTAKPAADGAGERHPDRPQRTCTGRTMPSRATGRPQRPATDRPHRRTKALAG
ncbi:hypothetical protein ACH4OW_02465 [Streptomyces sp. NPDC017056]|uniref:hypothetical protein n=1 Tax=Streptomyces sp. NPDC017056 TaxID=3364973 RepID=UPI0037A318D1